MAQNTITLGARREAARREGGGMGFLEGIGGALRVRGTAMQRVLCALMMALLTAARLPGGGYACQTAMFAVLLRLGCCVPAAFSGRLAQEVGAAPPFSRPKAGSSPQGEP